MYYWFVIILLKIISTFYNLILYIYNHKLHILLFYQNHKKRWISMFLILLKSINNRNFWFIYFFIQSYIQEDILMTNLFIRYIHVNHEIIESSVLKWKKTFILSMPNMIKEFIKKIIKINNNDKNREKEWFDKCMKDLIYEMIKI